MDSPDTLTTLGTQDTGQRGQVLVKGKQCMQAKTNNMNKTWAFLLTTGSKHEHDIYADIS